MAAATAIPPVDFHLKLMKSSFKVPLELIKKNAKAIAKSIERQNQTLLLNITKLAESDDIQDKVGSFQKIVANYEQFHLELRKLIDKHNDYVERIECRFAKFKQFELMRERQRDSTELTEELSNWYKDQIDLMICHYLIRTGSIDVGYKLLKQKQFEKFCDFDIIEEGLNIYKEIKDNKNLTVLIEWCNLNKKNLNKLNNNGSLEFETYFQKFIELLKEQKIFESIELSKKYLINNINNKEQEVNLNFSKPTLRELVEQSSNVTLEEEEEDNDDSTKEGRNREREYLDKLISASRLLLFDSLELSETFGFENSQEQRKSSLYSKFLNRFHKRELTPLDYYNPTSNEYNELSQNFLSKCLNLYSLQKWTKLANFFLYNFNLIYSINQNLEFLIMLSTGISSLKTKSCNHDLMKRKNGENLEPEAVNFDEFVDKSSEELLIKTLNNCPICSLELKKLSTSLPYSHQIVSNIFHSPVMLPNGNIYQLNKLLKINENLNIPEVQVSSSSVPQVEPHHHLNNHKNSLRLFSGNKEKRIYKVIYNDNHDDFLVEKTSSDSDSSDVSGIKSETTGSLESELDSVRDENFFEKEVFNDDLIFEDLKYLGDFKFKDPLSNEIFNSSDLVKVFPT